MRLLTLFAAVTLLAVTCEAGSKCKWGPSYWCQSADTAKECEQESYCEQTVWAMKEEVSIKGTVECDVCEMVVKEIANLVETKSTEAEAEVVVKRVCVYTGPLADQCRSLINKYFDDIWNMVTKKLDASKVCELIKLCAPSKTRTLQLAGASGDDKVKVKTSSYCKVCSLVVNFLKPYLDNKQDEAKMKTELDNLCGLLPGAAKSTCTSFVDNNLDKIWELLEKGADSGQVCSELGVCTSHTPVFKVETRPKSAAANVCSICEAVMSFIKPFVDLNSTESEVKTAIDNFCKLLPKEISNNCTKMENEYFGLIWLVIKGEVDSGEVCKQIGLCTSKVATKQQFERKMVKDVCDTCKLVVNFLKPYIDSNSTEAEVESALDSVCGVLPSTVSSQCTTLVDDYFDMIWMLLKNDVDSGEICQQIGLCNSTLRVQPKFERKMVKAGLCDTCKMVVGFIKPYVDSDATEKEVNTTLETICGLLPSSANTECKGLVAEYFSIIWSLLKQEVDSGDICMQIGLCNSTLSTQPKAEVEMVSVSGTGCSICDTIISFLDMLVNEKTTEEEVRNGLEKFCGLLKSSECTSLVTNYFNMVWELVKGELNNDEFCKQTNLCPSVSPAVLVSLPKATTVCDLCKTIISFVRPFIDSDATETEAKDAVESVCNSLPSTFKSECTPLVDQYFGMIWKLVKSYVDDASICQEIGLCSNATATVQNIKAPKAGVKCVLCESVLKEVFQILKGNTATADIESALDKVCSILPSTVSTECKNLVDKYAGLMIKLIAEGLDPEQICTAMTLCQQNNAPLSSPKASVKCILCEFVLKEVDTLLSGNITQTAIESTLDKVCSILPSTLTKECDEFVDDYAPQIIHLLLNEIDPEQICNIIGLCSSSVKLAAPKASVECTLCEFVLKELDNILNGNTTQTAVENALKQVCSALPSTLQSTCDDFVDNYATQIIDLLVNDLLKPDQICTAIGLCSSTVKVAALKVILPTKSTRILHTELNHHDQSLPTIGGPLCALCELVLEKLDSMLDSNATEAAIKSGLDKVCSVLPSTVSTECTKFVNQYGPMIMKLIFEGAVPKVVCHLLHLCIVQPATVQLTETTKSAAIDECEVCKFTLDAIKTLIGAKATQSEVEAALVKACSLIPKEIAGECESLVKEYGPQIIQLLDQKVEPEKLCKEVKLCKSKEVNVLMQPWMKMVHAREH